MTNGGGEAGVDKEALLYDNDGGIEDIDEGLFVETKDGLWV